MKLEPGHSRCCFRQIFVILFLGGATSLFAGHFQTSFNTDLPAQAKLSGEAVLTQAGGVDNNGALRLTKAHPNQQGTLLLNDLDPGEKIFSFQLAFNLLIAGSDNDKNGDGFSINFAPDLPDQFGAKGAGNGLSICFDTYQKIPDMPGFTIRVKYKGKEVASAFCMLRKEAGYAETKVQLDSDSALTLSYNGTTVLDHSHLFNFVPTTGRFGFGASTSDRFDKHVIDNLSIETDTSRRSADHSYLLPGHNRVLLPQYMSRSLQLGDKEQNTIQALAQTSEGYLWIGTQKGLARSDGMTFTFYTPENTPEITNASVNVLLVAKDGSLWVGTEGGLFQYKNGRFARIARGLLDERVRSLCQIKDGSLLIGTSKGVVRYKGGALEKFMPELEFEPKIVRSICEDTHGDIWLAIDKKLHHVNIKDSKLTTYTEGKKMPGHFVKSILADRKGGMWFGSDTGIGALQDEKWSYYTTLNGLSHNLTYSIFEDSRDNIWIGTFNGLNRLTDGKISTELNNRDETFDSVNALCEDREGDLWIGSKDGLYQIQPRRVRYYTQKQGLGNNKVMSLLEDHKGAMWITTWGGGLNRLKDDKFTTYSSTNLMRANNLQALHEDHNGDLWAGTAYGQLYHLSNGRMQDYSRTNTVNSSRSNVVNAIRVIYEDSKTNLWIGSRIGLVQVNPGYTWSDLEQSTNYTHANGLPSDNVRAIVEDREGYLWFGTEAGLSRWKDGTFTNFTTSDGLTSPNIFGLYEDKEQSLWIATSGGGLNRYRNGKFTSYSTKQGLWSDDLEEVVEDDLGNLWIRCAIGLFNVSKKSLDDLDRGIIKKVSCFTLDKSNGIPGFSKNETSKPSAWKSKDGKLWFPGIKGVAVIDPALNLKKNNTVPTIIIEEVLVDQKPYKPTVSKDGASVEVPPGRGQLEIRYTALSLQAPEKNQFRFKLEGVDAEWVDVGTRRVAYYNHIPPGDHLFRVMGCNNNGVWNEAGATLTFHLEPHFYQTSWFLFGGLLLSAALVAGIYRLTVHRLKNRQKILEALVDERTKYLKTEIAERQRVQTQLIEVSRKAGMAEVASGVLHNVGNVLNSVNVSAILVADSLRNSKLSSLKKVAAMLQDHADDPVQFLSQDEKGKQLPGYIPRLTEHLVQEQTAIIKELDSICKNVDHIKDIVAMQQTYAKVSGVVETANLPDLVEDALRMNAGALARHDIQVVRDYADKTSVSTQKHKVIQILVNLIGNAKYACDEGGQLDKLVKVSTARKNTTHVAISVSDNGIGIPAENLVRIFSHGFTTRKEGHGFGLHSSALAATELGGSLSVQSDGHGKGATFTLEIPIQAIPSVV